MKNKQIARPLLIDLCFDRTSPLTQVALIASGSLFLTLASKAAIPVGPVPITCQLFALLLLGITLGSRLGTTAVLVYLTQGLCGLPVFYDMIAGPIKFAGPTGGYLIGMIPAVWIAGYAAERGKDRSFWTVLPWLAVAHQSMYLCGILWLYVLLGNWQQTFQFGYWPFIGWDVLKYIIVAGFVAQIWRRQAR